MLKKYFYSVLPILLLSGCASNEHLVFFTNSTIGIEIASEPQTGTPAKFIVGYKRQEGVIDPVNKGTEAHSVIAKLDFGATGGQNNNGTKIAQWFATGKAADFLANNNNISTALTDQKSLDLEFTKNLNNSNASFSHLNTVYSIINELSEKDEKAKNIKLKVDNLVNILNLEPFNEIRTQIKNNKEEEIISLYIPKKTNFSNIISYLSKLEKTKQENENKLKVKSYTAENKNKLNETIILYYKNYPKIKTILENDKNVINMITFFYEQILLKEKDNS